MDVALKGNVSRGVLLDRGGQRLAVDVLPAADVDEHRVRANLPPGRYFFRVEDGEGSYEITATPSRIEMPL